MWLFILVALLLVFLYSKMRQAHSYWKEKGIRYVRPWPFLGFMAPTILQLKSLPHVMQSLYNTFPEQRYFGCYQFLAPSLVVRDPVLIKTIMVKEFDTFPEHRAMADPDDDPLWAKNLFAMPGGDEWKDMRSTLSPAFTSSKMRNMFVLMKDVAKQFTQHYLKQGGTVTLEMKDSTTRFANDVIASTAFGITCDSLQNPTNEFYSMSKTITEFTIIRFLKFFAYVISPYLTKLLKFRFFGEHASKFYRSIVKETIALREEKGIVRPDMIHLLMEARKGRLTHEDQVVLDSGFAVVQESEIGKTHKRQKTEITDDDITAQVVLFFIAGFETVSTAMSHLTHELAVNPEIQEKLRDEVDEMREECQGDINYEALLKMKYLDMVVTETLRKWPPVIANNRKSVKPFTIKPEKVWEKSLTLDAGTVCLVPFFAIHRDPKNYPEPDKFDPERFSDENKHKVKPFTYLPFGAGPRNCIGSRFALLEIKTFVFYLLSEFEVVRVEKTQHPLVLSKTKVAALPEKGFWVGLKPRHKKVA